MIDGSNAGAAVVVGIDGGGTKTRLECYDAGEFRLIASGDGGPCNIAAMPVESAVGSVETALRDAGIEPESVRALYAAVAGYSHEAHRAEFRRRLDRLFPGASVVKIAPDYEAAFHSAVPNGSGVLVVAGTGSIAFARTAAARDGGGARSARAGGYGYLLDDAGSGYGVGRQGLAAMLAAREGLGEATALGERIAQQLGWAAGGLDRDVVVREVYFGALDRARVASLAEAVSAAAEAGDAVAARILMHAGGALARLAEAAGRQVFGRDWGWPDAVPVARVGSLWRAGTALTSVFERSLARFAPGAVFSPGTDRTPAWGAAQMALTELRRSEA